MLLFLMGAGLAIGSQAAQAWLPPVVLAKPLAVPDWAIWLAIAALGVSLLAVLQAPLGRAHHRISPACRHNICMRTSLSGTTGRQQAGPSWE